MLIYCFLKVYCSKTTHHFPIRGGQLVGVYENGRDNAHDNDDDEDDTGYDDDDNDDDQE